MHELANLENEELVNNKFKKKMRIFNRNLEISIFHHKVLTSTTASTILKKN